MKFASVVNNMRKQKGAENNNLAKICQSLILSLREKRRATVNLPKLVCVVNNMQGTSI